MAPPHVRLPHDKIRSFCIRHHIRELSLFGSILTPRFRADSDVDVLVEFERGNAPGLFALSAMEAELSELLGRKADVRTPEELSRYFRDEALRTAAAEYECE